MRPAAAVGQPALREADRARVRRPHPPCPAGLGLADAAHAARRSAGSRGRDPAHGNPVVEETTSSLPTPPEPTSGATTGGAPPRANPAARRPGLIRWPRGRDGWTIVLISLPQTGGGAPARAKAQEALDKGLREVGVIDSNRFASLHPGYYVVFTGVYTTPEEAASALQRAKAAFPLAYTREIAS